MEEPAISLTGPGSTTPAPRAQACESAPPRTTGTVPGNPKRLTSAGRSSPITSAERRIGGSDAGSIASAASISALQRPACRS